LKSLDTVRVLCLSAYLSVAGMAHAQGDSFQVISVPGSIDTSTAGMNDAGDIVGGYLKSDNTSHGFVYHAGAFSDVYYPESDYTTPEGINSSGEIAGFYQTNHVLHGFLDSAGTYSTLDYPGASTTLIFAINNIGDLVGVSDGSQGGFLYSGGQFTPINYPGGANTGLLGINDSRQIVGYYDGSNGHAHGFLKSEDTYTTIDFPVGAQDTFLVGINNRGQIFGYYTDSGFLNHAFLYEGGTFTRLPLPSLAFAYFTGFNDAAQFVGFYVNPSETGFLATPN
jgi:probable HAF family extracellular repeat protein